MKTLKKTDIGRAEREIRIQRILRIRARRGKTISYSRLAKRLGLSPDRCTINHYIAPILGEMLLESWLPALVVRKDTGIPGNGFWWVMDEIETTPEERQAKAKEYLEYAKAEVLAA